ncbi:MAG: ATP-binding cassette domain-containing protein [Candidatus Thiodiazotropha lotti]|uniref:ATP-binding protein Uup n=1 Tax=Candidatus Thiodiazotropha lotti TaxID=2792787 RepID=A0A9E4N1P1_9GAMM|nr:ATP-binding cassette domain-containing protein [Candidatus Thiodiazotropha lotti]ODC01491.1 ABC transporter ATP-binding protein [Candidatus Thiodiazotropha endoloripes]MCG7920624.1 ATP-binding cassette domain-containing protein [Candidatus Thiodiazotropha lotti]MCG7940055.1 ATP-binding cassette domain-containing protein [Candidatus Thiodiazotropha lotti]MCG7988246.1 ATP-binding cassette domain-containing protein [Candidatus Thiodiazotropha lotti]
MPLITLRNLHLSFGDAPLLDGIELSIEKGERIALLGRNGMGKSTLMKVIMGTQQADDGDRVVSNGVSVARLIQEVPQDIEGTVYDLVADGIGDLAEKLKTYHRISHRLGEGDQSLLDSLAKAQHDLEAAGGWQLEQRVETTISRTGLDADAKFGELSGGMKRRVLLAQALVAEPDLLLLDEPTNHLDIEAIDWMENLLLGFSGAVLFVTHDRAFLRRLATRILELDRGELTDWPGNYDNFLRRKEEMLNAEAQANARFDKKLAQEEIWIRQGIKARRTRNEGRVRQLKSMRDERSKRRSSMGQVKMQLQTAERSGKLVVEVDDVSYAWEEKPIIRGLSTTIMRGDRVGIIGPNGSGKTTLLNLLLGQLQPEQGQVKLGTQIQVAYFDQLRSQLNESLSVQENVGGGSDKVEIDGKSKHIISYLQDFLFTPERARAPVNALSGGERNRLLLAKLFTKPANVLVLDEPTNDLDIETLELLEELLVSYQGTLLLVSHDREFLDHSVTSCLIFEGEGRVIESVGGYSDWEQKQQQITISRDNAAQEKVKSQRQKPKNRTAKLSYKDQRELDQLPQQIEQLEQSLSGLQEQLSDPDLYQTGEAEQVVELQQQMTEVEHDLEQAYARWEELETFKAGG